jgi:glycosyltransferase involved in cell wall biosynthesis
MPLMQQVIPLLNREKSPLRVALVHDYLVQDGGAERVLAALQEIYPNAPTFTLFYDPDRAHPSFRGKDIRTSMLQKWPFTKRHENWTLPFMPMAVEHLDFTGYDLVLSSSSSFAKGVIAAPGAMHVCYLHTPTRFLWQERMSYVNDLPQPRIVKSVLPHFLHRLRMWDRLAAERPDVLVTNSETSRRRIKRYYGRDSTILHPPVDVHTIPRSDGPGSYWLTGGRLVGYKKFDLTVRAFAKLNLPLKVFGIGPELPRLKTLAGPNTEFLGHVRDDDKANLYRNAIGFIHPQVEDFGITAVEAMAAGKPVIAYGEGGSRETIRDGITGHVIEAQTWEDIGDAVIRFDPSAFDPIAIRAHAELFSKQRFQDAFKLLIDRLLAQR